jgi:hypothetical protein
MKLRPKYLKASIRESLKKSEEEGGNERLTSYVSG